MGTEKKQVYHRMDEQKAKYIDYTITSYIGNEEKGV